MAERDEVLAIVPVSADALYGLRRRVLREDRADARVADARDEDTAARHFGGYVGERLVASASFYPGAAPVNPALSSYQLRFMAVDFDAQGHGYGAAVLAEAERALTALGVEQLWANGRDTALGFYRSVGWRIVEGSAHLSEETALPHHVIYKVLRTPHP